jgi:streptogramin lyase
VPSRWVTTVGAVIEYGAGITAAGAPVGIVAGPDGNLWFTENSGNRIGRLVLATAPTNKDQCKNGGWQTFNSPTFTNQGDCVSHVETTTVTAATG